MIREIKNKLACIKTYIGKRYYVEYETEDELAIYVAGFDKKGYVTTSVTQICMDGSTPRIAIKSNKVYKNEICN